MINLEQKAAGLLAVCALSAGMAATGVWGDQYL